MGASVVAYVDAAPVLQATEHVFDAVTLAIQDGVVRDQHSSQAGGGDAGCNAALSQHVWEAVAVMAR